MYNATGKTGLNCRLIVSFATVSLAIIAFCQWAEIQSLTKSLIQSRTQIGNLIVQVQEHINGARVKIDGKDGGQAEVKTEGQVEVAGQVEVKTEGQVEVKDQVEADILKLKMEDPSLFTVIRNKYLVAPSSEPYKLKEPLKKQYPQYPGIVELLDDLFPMTTTMEKQGQRQKFFVEAGAFDGEYLSNTLNLERDGNWTGLLVEPNPMTFKRLKAKNRKSWLLNSCLSTETKPTNLTLEFHKKIPEISRIQKTDSSFGDWERSAAIKKTMTCLPIFSILSAINVSTVDFFSLDVEGAEVDVLRTIPFDKLYIKVFLIEQWPRKNTQQELIDFMEEKKYIRKPFSLSRENFLFLHPKFIRENE